MPGKLWVCEQWLLKSGQNMGKNLQETNIMGPLLLLFFTGPGRVPGVGGLAGVRVHTSAYTAHTVAIAGKTGILGNRDLKCHPRT